MVVDHFEALEADLLRIYRLDLVELLWGATPCTARRLRVLVQGLPTDALVAVELGRSHPGWGQTEELLATIAEVIDVGNRWFYSAHAKKGSRPPEPLKIRRPWKKRRRATSEDLVEMFGGVARYTGPPIEKH